MQFLTKLVVIVTKICQYWQSYVNIDKGYANIDKGYTNVDRGYGTID